MSDLPSSRADHSPSRNKGQTDILYIRNLPVRMKQEFKDYCAKRGWTMTEAIYKAMRMIMKKDKLSQRERECPPRGPKPRRQS